MARKQAAAEFDFTNISTQAANLPGAVNSQEVDHMIGLLSSSLSSSETLQFAIPGVLTAKAEQLLRTAARRLSGDGSSVSVRIRYATDQGERISGQNARHLDDELWMTFQAIPGGDASSRRYTSKDIRAWLDAQDRPSGGKLSQEVRAEFRAAHGL